MGDLTIRRPYVDLNRRAAAAFPYSTPANCQSSIRYCHSPEGLTYPGRYAGSEIGFNVAGWIPSRGIACVGSDRRAAQIRHESIQSCAARVLGPLALQESAVVAAEWRCQSEDRSTMTSSARCHRGFRNNRSFVRQRNLQASVVFAIGRGK
jgi:hypothetical protein